MLILHYLVYQLLEKQDSDKLIVYNDQCRTFLLGNDHNDYIIISECHNRNFHNTIFVQSSLLLGQERGSLRK